MSTYNFKAVLSHKAAVWLSQKLATRPFFWHWFCTLSIETSSNSFNSSKSYEVRTWTNFK